MRLRTALHERARHSEDGGVEAGPATVATASDHQKPDHDDFYLRRGPFSRGPLHDGPWSMELDEVTRWLDEERIGGTIVELGAGTGWWSALLAEKGDLWIYDPDDAALELARKRLVSHGLRAHLHERASAADPERSVDVVVGAYVLGRAEDPGALATQSDVLRRWLRPGGRFHLIEAGPASGPDGATMPGPGSTVVVRDAAALEDVLRAAGFASTGIAATSAGSFLMGTADAP